MKRSYDVVSEGRLLPGAERRKVLSHMQSAFKIDLRTAEKLILGKPRVLKRNLDEADARRYVNKLALIGLDCRMEMSSEPAPKKDVASPEPRPVENCPKCGFQLGAGDRSECPGCGIFIAKYLEAASNKDTPPGPDDSSRTEKETAIVEAETRPAPWFLRVSAGIASIVVCIAVSNLLWFFCALLLRIKFHEQLSTPTADGVWHADEHTLYMVGAVRGVALLLSIVFALFYFVFRPAKAGGTWAQRFSNIEIVSNDPKRHPGIATWAIRFVGNLATLGLILWTLDLIRQSPTAGAFLIFFIPLGGYLLFISPGWLRGKKRLCLADRYSKTHLVQRGKESLLPFLWIVIVIVAGFSYGIMSAADSMLRPPNEAAIEQRKRDAGMEKSMRLYEVVRELEERFHAENGHYTDELRDFLDATGKRRKKVDRSLVIAWLNGLVDIDLTEEGYIVKVREKVNSRYAHVVDENGYQGMWDETGKPVGP